VGTRSIPQYIPFGRDALASPNQYRRMPVFIFSLRRRVAEVFKIKIKVKIKSRNRTAAQWTQRRSKALVIVSRFNSIGCDALASPNEHRRMPIFIFSRRR
jgi:hypothetical protein